LNYRTEEWDKDFFNYIKNLENKNKAVILTGDLNLDQQDIDIYETKGKEKLAGFTP
jgi:exodeoxyribonuclease-3